MHIDRSAMQVYELGPDFLPSLDRQLASRQQIVRAVADVVTGNEFRRSYRKAHMLHDHSGRDDHARGWRCCVSQRPSGPRLLWWKYPNGGVELVKITDHDHATLP